jgi:hypothetical protein
MCNNPIPRDAVKCERAVLQRRPIVETRWRSKISVRAGVRVPMRAMRGSWHVQRIQMLHRVQSAHRKPPSDRTPTGLRDTPRWRHLRRAEGIAAMPLRRRRRDTLRPDMHTGMPVPRARHRRGTGRLASGLHTDARTHARTHARGACRATGGVADLARRPAQLSRTVQRRRRRDETRRPAGRRDAGGKGGEAPRSGTAPSG